MESKVPVCREMQKLRQWLCKKNYDWMDNSSMFHNGDYVCRTIIFLNGGGVHVINGFMTDGGYFFEKEANEGLLEYFRFGDLTDDKFVKGSLTALECERLLRE